MAETPLISVIIPVYNAEKYIVSCVASVQAQGIPEMEILCVDDGSADGSVKLLEELAAEDRRIRVICQENRTAGAARNNGLDHARGKYVHFLDADDRVCPGIYRRTVSRLEETGAEVCMFQYLLLDDSTGEEKPCPCLLSGRERVTGLRQEPAFFLYNMVAPWNKVYRREWIEAKGLRFDEIPCGNDRGFYFRMLAAGGKIALCMDHGVAYRVKNAASLTGGSRWKHMDSLFFAWDTSRRALSGESRAVRAMLLDCVMKDLLAVYRQAPEEGRPVVLAQLRRRLEGEDLSLAEALPFPCLWRRDAELICQGREPAAGPEGPADRLRRMMVLIKIFGLRGCLIKARGR